MTFIQRLRAGYSVLFRGPYTHVLGQFTGTTGLSVLDRVGHKVNWYVRKFPNPGALTKSI